MKIKSSFVLGLIVLVSLLGGLSLMSRLNEEQETWRPNDVYSSLGGSQGSSFSAVSYSSVASDDAVAPISSGASSMFRHRAAFSYAHAGAGSSAISSSPMASMPQGGLYATSSAEVRTFGSGGNSVSMSGGSIKSAPAPASTSEGGVSMHSLAFTTTTSGALLQGGLTPEHMNDLAVASVSSYSGMGLSAGGPVYRGIRGPQLAPPGLGGSDEVSGSWLQWLYEQLGTGDHQFTEEELRALYDQYIASHSGGSGIWDDMPTWEDWLAWFTEDEDGYDYEDGHFSMLPVGDVWALLVFAVIYTAYVVVRKRKRVEA
jgi:hypothetical protein